ncbi:biotin--[acetyl-CoA-carboxylase] ligase [Nonlabens sp. Ci31]|uniref:biotin--[acetyl-CoA-carboxylase] ligase n=1 Tax=Nonlabens sp. Ci31 TaxID=2608253 RepID=UPI001462FE29|nr:biotin--[acetyl-CoA-carboxylase] ligase [Nonlabens sp. Ci31]QJP34452.1 biotin--[acetyl-CoA-carboxylase] ligase [Nonlabens sp. Ci31]
MNIVKLHATTSTNDELKSRFRESELPHLTTIYTMEQTRGKGQQGAIWISEKGKNLTFSILITKNIQHLTPFLVNQTVSVTIVEWLKRELQVQAKIKWPNDILSVQHKLAGILIENFFSGTKLTHAVVGIGLNVNQETFESLPRAISLKNITGREFDLESLLISFLSLLKNNLRDPLRVAQEYNRYLFRYNQMTSFKSSKGSFEGVVKGTDPDGKLLLQINDVLSSYELKELEWMY